MKVSSKFWSLSDEDLVCGVFWYFFGCLRLEDPGKIDRLTGNKTQKHGDFSLSRSGCSSQAIGLYVFQLFFSVVWCHLPLSMIFIVNIWLSPKSFLVTLKVIWEYRRSTCSSWIFLFWMVEFILNLWLQHFSWLVSSSLNYLSCPEHGPINDSCFDVWFRSHWQELLKEDAEQCLSLQWNRIGDVVDCCWGGFFVMSVFRGRRVVFHIWCPYNLLPDSTWKNKLKCPCFYFHDCLVGRPQHQDTHPPKKVEGPSHLPI